MTDIPTQGDLEVMSRDRRHLSDFGVICLAFQNILLLSGKHTINAVLRFRNEEDLKAAKCMAMNGHQPPFCYQSMTGQKAEIPRCSLDGGEEDHM